MEHPLAGLLRLGAAAKDRLAVVWVVQAAVLALRQRAVEGVVWEDDVAPNLVPPQPAPRNGEIEVAAEVTVVVDLHDHRPKVLQLELVAVAAVELRVGRVEPLRRDEAHPRARLLVVEGAGVWAHHDALAVGVGARGGAVDRS